MCAANSEACAGHGGRFCPGPHALQPELPSRTFLEDSEGKLGKVFLELAFFPKSRAGQGVARTSIGKSLPRVLLASVSASVKGEQ